MFTPNDYEKTRDAWEAEGLGACGPSVVAVASGVSVQEAINDWEGGYFGTANVGAIEKELQKHLFATKRVRGNKSKQLFIPAGYSQAVAFIQWGEHKHWIEAQKHTHWVYLMVPFWKESALYVFCNGVGWFPADSEYGRKYLENGHIRSVIALSSMTPLRALHQAA